MTNEELAQSIRAPMFADRPTLKDAFAYAHELAQSSDCPAAVLTAVHVVANTIAKQLREAAQ
jgi:hemoglobin-like flavoprotein